MSTQPKKSITSVLDSQQLYNSPFNLGENNMTQVSCYGITNSEEVDFIGAQGSLVALNTYLVRGNESTKGCIGVNRNRIINLIQKAILKINSLSITKRLIYIKYLIVLAFNKRDIRGTYGGGERTLSYWYMLELAKHYPDTLLNLFEELPEIGSWLDFKYIYGICCEDLKTETNKKNIIILEKIKTKLIDIQITQLNLDEMTINKNDYVSIKKLSLLAKWIPKQGSEYSRNYKIDKEIAKKYFPKLWKQDFRKACKALRKLVSKLNTAILTTEKFMCAKDFSNIKFELVPGRCLNKGHLTWLDENKIGKRRHDDDYDRDIARENYLNFLDKMKSGKAYSKGKSLFIHEIVNEVYNLIQKYENTENFKNKEPEKYELLNSQFNDHYKNIVESSDNYDLADCIFQVDTSSSMKGDPLGVSVGVGVLGASLPGNKYSNRLITFETTPRWIILDYPHNMYDYKYTYPGYRSNTYPLGEFDRNKVGVELDWIEKIAITACAGWGSSTNFISAVEMISEASQLACQKMPSKIICITDMQWDLADRGEHYVENYTSITNTKPLPITSYKYVNCIDDFEHFFQNTFIPGTNEPLGMPKFIVWNVRGNQENVGFVVGSNDTRVQMISGFSVALLKLFLKKGVFDKESTSWDCLQEILDHCNYNNIKNIIDNTGEVLFNYQNNNINYLENKFIPSNKLGISYIIPKKVNHNSKSFKYKHDINYDNINKNKYRVISNLSNETSHDCYNLLNNQSVVCENKANNEVIDWNKLNSKIDDFTYKYKKGKELNSIFKENENSILDMEDNLYKFLESKIANYKTNHNIA